MQEIFAPEIAKVDMGFFQRLEESKFYAEDKSINQKNTLFNDPNFDDKAFYKEYKTIYHLRKALIEGGKEFDIRLLYLAIHHIIKYRGNFLFEGRNFSEVTDFEQVFNELKFRAEEACGISILSEYSAEFKEILENNSLGVKRKQEAFKEKFPMEMKNKKFKAMTELISGGKKSISDILDKEELNEKLAETEGIKDGSIRLSDSEIDSQLEILSEILEEEDYNYLTALNNIYNWSVLTNILKGNEYLSYGMAEIFEKHEDGLKLLKAMVRKYCPQKYAEIFKTTKKELKNYCAYVGQLKKNGKNVPIIYRCNDEDFYGYLKGVFKNIKADDEELLKLLNEIENGTLVPKQKSGKNGVIPYQLHERELNKILENASEYMPFLNVADNEGYTPIEKIKSLLTFRIPYYVGPLNDRHSKEKGGFAWIEKKEGRVLPWNFDKMVDTKESAKRFILNMTNKCTYMLGEDVLPKYSVLYNKFMVLNELNNLKIDGHDVDVSLKNRIYKELFLNPATKKVTEKALRDYLKTIGCDCKDISGIDNGFKNNMSTDLAFKRAMGDKADNIAMVEDIIRYSTLFGESRAMLKEYINEKYKNLFTPVEIKNITAIKCKDWGSLSEKFLTGIKDEKTGLNIIDAMYETGQNLMELMSNKYGYLKAVEEYNRELVREESLEELIDNAAVSPAVKRSMIRTMDVIKDIIRVMGHAPSRIFIEMPRGEEEKKRTISRKDRLKELYKSLDKDIRDFWLEKIEGETEESLRRDVLYFYYQQLGRCMYTNEELDFSLINNSNIYDVDHIFPQSLVKDDSLENRVLVKREVNNYIKKDTYPIMPEIQNKMYSHWKMLHDKGLIGDKKFNRLIRKEPFSDNELSGFIERQIVETSQSIKAIAHILEKAFPDSTVVYVKAGDISDFRHKFNMVKVRDLNDFHHAKDAYLSIVVGNCYYTKFTKDVLRFVKENRGKRSYNMNRFFEFDVVDKLTGEVVWKADKKGSTGGSTIELVHKEMSRNDIRVTKFAVEGKGEFYNATIAKKGVAKPEKGYIPLKGGDERLKDVTKYGGYTSVSTAYFFCVDHKVKDNRIRTIETVPVYLSKKINNKEELKDYCVNNLGLIEPEIIVEKIKLRTLAKINGFYYYLNSKTDKNIGLGNAVQFITDKEKAEYIKVIGKIFDRLKKNKNYAIIPEADKITAEKNVELYDLFVSKMSNGIYMKCVNNKSEELMEYRDNFINISLENQVRTLYYIISFFNGKTDVINCSLIGGGEKIGKLRYHRDLNSPRLATKITEFKLIYQSPAGLHTVEKDLLNS